VLHRGGRPPRRARASDVADVIERRAIGAPLVALLGVIVLLDQVLGLGAIGPPPRSAAPLTARLQAALLTVAVLGLVLLLGRWTWLRTRFAQRHASVSVASVALAVQVGLTVGRRTVGPGDVAAPPGYALDEFVFLLGATLVVLLLLSALHRHRARRDELEASAARLRAALVVSTTGLVEERRRLTTHVRELLEERLGPTSIRPALFTPERLRAVADDVLRPLSHQLAAGAELPGTRVGSSVRRARVAEVLRSLDAGPVLRPRLLAATMLLLTFRFSITPVPSGPDVGPPDASAAIGDAGVITVDWTSLLESLALHAATFLIVLVGARIVARWLEGREARRGRSGPAVPHAARLARDWALAAATLVVLGLASLALLRGVFTVTGFGTLPPLTAGSLVGFTAPLLLITVVTSLLPATERALGATRERLAELNTDLAAASARANALLEHERRLFARQLHASVQPAVNAASLMIERATREGHVDPAVLADAADMIEASVERLLGAEDGGTGGGADGSAGGSAGGESDLNARLAAIAATWEGLADVQIDLDVRVRAHLSGDPVARATLCDVIAEACANAVIHGRAGRIDVTVRPDGEATDDEGAPGTALTAVELRVADDGRAEATRHDQGLGSRILTASSTRWALDHRDDGTVLTAVLPVR
jgi:signal transduction histidine kinase